MNIYISPAIEEQLRRYDGSMSGLINRLLTDFFKNNPSAATGVRRDVDKADDGALTVMDEQGEAPDPEKVNRLIKTPEGAQKAVKSLKPVGKDNPVMKFCPNDHPIPEGRTKCTGKGCKYSK